MLHVIVPDNNMIERAYIVHVLLNVFLGLEYELDQHNKAETHIILDRNAKLVVMDHFWSKYPEENEYLNQRNIPTRTKIVNNKFAPEADIPVIFGSNEFEVLKKKLLVA